MSIKSKFKWEEFKMECECIRRHKFKKYYSKKYKVRTYGLVVPHLDGTMGFTGEDGKQYNTIKDDLELIENEEDVQE